MFQFDFSYTDYEQLMNDLAQRLNVPVVNHQLIFPESVASGSLTFIRLPNGIHVNIVNCKFNQDWLLCRRKMREQFYTLRFHELTIPGILEIRIGDERLKESNTSRSIAYLTDSLIDWGYLGAKGTVYKGIDVLFSPKWLADYLGLQEIDDVLSAYLSLKVENVHREPLDSEYRRLIQEIVEAEESNPLRLAIIQNRIMLLIERFFLRIYQRRKTAFLNIPLSKADIDRVMKVEATLTRDIFEPAPTISQLARMVSISESKLKKDFKLIYGIPVYEYFQKVRMQAARDKLLAGGHSVKAVAMELGYSNLSNFTIAFKKEFGLLPSKLLTPY
ncbi:helix-turn-helix transcriptional regulator [Puia sp.]|uniref:helix-turn-helix domain-containing protein n=1 Tax=Puia sp. TaxID=2045100 RepID=UPI002F41557D